METHHSQDTSLQGSTNGIPGDDGFSPAQQISSKSGAPFENQTTQGTFPRIDPQIFNAAQPQYSFSGQAQAFENFMKLFTDEPAIGSGPSSFTSGPASPQGIDPQILYAAQPQYSFSEQAQAFENFMKLLTEDPAIGSGPSSFTSGPASQGIDPQILYTAQPQSLFSDSLAVAEVAENHPAIGLESSSSTSDLAPPQAYSDSENVLLGLLKAYLNQSNGPPVAWDVSPNPGVHQHEHPAGGIIDASGARPLSNIPDDNMNANLAPSTSSNPSEQDVLSVHSFSTVVTTQSDAELRRQAKKTASATELLQGKKMSTSRLNLSNLRTQSNYWAAAIENAQSRLIRNISALPDGPFSDPASCKQYAADTLASVVTEMAAKPSVIPPDGQYDIHHSRFPNLVVNVLKSVFDLCQKAAVSLTASGAEVDDKTRVRGFRLLALTPSGAEPSFDEIAARATSLLLDKAYCHISPADKDFGQPLAYELAYDVFFAAKKHSFGPNRSYAHNIKTYHDKYGYKSPLVAFVTFIPIEALAMCFTALQYTLEMRRNGYHEKRQFSNYLAAYRDLVALLYMKVKSDKHWAKRYLLDSAKAFTAGSRVF